MSTIKTCQTFLNNWTKELLLKFCQAREINVNSKKNKEEIIDVIIVSELAKNSSISSCQNCPELFFQDYLKLNDGNCYSCVISETKRTEKHILYSDFIEKTFNYNNEYIKNLEETLDELKDKIVQTETLLKNKISDMQEIKGQYEQKCQSLLNLQNYVLELQKENEKNKESVSNLICERKIRETELISQIDILNAEKKELTVQFLENQKKLLQFQNNSFFSEPKIISAIYHTQDVTAILVKNIRNYRFTFVEKDTFNVLFGDPAPGVKKQLHLTYKNVFGDTVKQSYNESGGVNIDLLR